MRENKLTVKEREAPSMSLRNRRNWRVTFSLPHWFGYGGRGEMARAGSRLFTCEHSLVSLLVATGLSHFLMRARRVDIGRALGQSRSGGLEAAVYV